HDIEPAHGLQRETGEEARPGKEGSISYDLDIVGRQELVVASNAEVDLYVVQFVHERAHPAAHIGIEAARTQKVRRYADEIFIRENDAIAVFPLELPKVFPNVTWIVAHIVG